MKITQLWTYPIKSLRGTAIDRAVVTKTGFLYDRRFMLLKLESGQDEHSFRNMAVTHFPQMTLFHTSIKFPEPDQEGEILVKYAPPSAESRTITIPLEPKTSTLSPVDVVMHGSPTKAYDMGSRYNTWFSECFGFQVVFAYLGEHLRPVLFTKSPNKEPVTSSWLSKIASYVPVLGPGEDQKEKITFQDCAPYLLVTEDSLHDVSNRLPEDEKMDITKFRPNIVLAGAEGAWDEDFWAEVQVGGAASEVRINLQHNCIRCQSINIDFATGKPGTGQSGQVLKLLQKDRRVDKLQKYSPVFGRYGFLATAGEGDEIAVGDEVAISKRNEERTGFTWPNL